MERVEDRYEGDYLEALDLPRPYTLTIKAIVPEGTERDKRKQLIREAMLVFEEAKKKLVLNKTNYRVLKALYGTDRKEWVGKKITIAKRCIEAFGHEDLLCVRIIPPKGTPLPMSVHKWMGQEVK